MNDTDLMTPPVETLVQLFSAQPGLKFPDLDAPALHEAVARVKERHVAVAHAEALVAAAKNALEEEQEALLKLAHRAQAYLKVFSEPDPALSEQVNALVLPRPRKPRGDNPLESSHDLTAPRKRGRPPKLRLHEASLFSATEHAAPT